MKNVFVGYASLILFTIGTACATLYLGSHGLSLYLGETSRDIQAAGAFVTQSDNLEKALLYWSFAALFALTTLVASIALLRSALEDLSRVNRGSVHSSEAKSLIEKSNQQAASEAGGAD